MTSVSIRLFPGDGEDILLLPDSKTSHQSTASMQQQWTTQ